MLEEAVRAEPMVRIHLPPAESPSLNGNWPGEVEKPAFRANVRAMPGDGVGRDRYGRGHRTTGDECLCWAKFQYRGAGDGSKLIAASCR